MHNTSYTQPVSLVRPWLSPPRRRRRPEVTRAVPRPGAWVWWLSAGALWLVVVVCSTPVASGAAEVQGLYEARVVVSDRSDAVRRQALLAALARVVVKVTGRPGDEWSGEFDAQAGDPLRYLGQYRYEETAPPAGASISPAAAGQLSLWVGFDPEAVNDLVRRMGLAVWGRLRPNVLVWAAIEQDGRRRVLGGADPGQLVAALDSQASGRGIPVVFPLLDLEDQTRLGVSDLWGGFGERILAASERYRCEAVLAGRAFPVGVGRWEGAWTLYLDGQATRWSVHGDSLEALFTRVVDGTADRLARRFAVASTGGVAGGWALRVTGIDSLADYARVSEYLARLDGVDEVRLAHAEGNRATFRLRSPADPELVRRQLTLGGVLVATGTGDGWVYELRR